MTKQEPINQTLNITNYKSYKRNLSTSAKSYRQLQWTLVHQSINDVVRNPTASDIYEKREEIKKQKTWQKEQTEKEKPWDTKSSFKQRGGRKEYRRRKIQSKCVGISEGPSEMRRGINYEQPACSIVKFCMFSSPFDMSQWLCLYIHTSNRSHTIW